MRKNNVRILSERVFDVLVIGGGINGAVSAAALAARGASVALIDKKDWASSTSQESSNLVWGGIKYLESYDFMLVNDLCKSRNQLIREYPSTVKEIRFLTTHEKTFRHWRISLYAATWMYWFFGRGFTQKPRLFSKKGLAKHEPYVDVSNSDGGIEYSDAYLHDNDARFVFSFVRSALNHGCIAANYIEALKTTRDSNAVSTTLSRDTISGQEFEIKSKIIINACGPEVDNLNEINGVKTRHRHVLSKGIHLIVDRITEEDRVLAFFADDGRLFFAIPMGPKTCIGTTDTRVDSLPTSVTDEDRDFVLKNINKRLNLKYPLTRKDIISERCGVRPLVVKGGKSELGDWMQLSRKHAIEVNENINQVNIFGGKLTDCLNVGEEVCDIVRRLGVKFEYESHKWFGEPGKTIHKDFLHEAKLMDLDGYTSKDSSEPLSERLWRRYGTEAFGLLEDIRHDPRNGEVLIEGAEYLRCEIQLAAKREMIVKLDDFLRRRSNITLITRNSDLKKARGLKEACLIFFGKDAAREFDEYFARY